MTQAQANQGKALSVLIAEDSDDDVELLTLHLRHNGYRPTCRRVETADAMADALRQARHDLILCDLSLPRLDVGTALRVASDSGRDLPFIIVSGRGPEEDLVDHMRAGAHDIVLKDQLARLVPAIERELKEADVRRQRRQSDVAIRFLATHDALTGLANPPAFHEQLQRALAYARRMETMAAVLLFDLDHFSHINEDFGHSVGDQMLCDVARRIEARTRESDVIGRLGGVRFGIVAPNIKETEHAETLSNKIVEAISEPFVVEDIEIHASASAATAVFPRDGGDAGVLLKNAEGALDATRGAGGRSYHAYGSRDEDDRSIAEADLRRALEDHEFAVLYQPQLDLRSGRTVGAEALIRWRRDDRRTVTPDQFIPIAERSGLIIEMGEFVMREACRDATAWGGEGRLSSSVAINISAVQLVRTNLTDLVGTVLDETGLPPHLLELEFKEAALAAEPYTAPRVLRDLSDLGVGIVIDNFGTGGTSITSLKHCGVSKIKIDGRVVQNLTIDDDDDAIARAIVGLGKTLDARVVAESVETNAQVSFLRDEGCDAAQGYFFARPLETARFARWLMPNHPARHVFSSQSSYGLINVQQHEMGCRLDTNA